MLMLRFGIMMERVMMLRFVRLLLLNVIVVMIGCG